MNILLVVNTPSPNTLSLRYAAAKGLLNPEFDGIQLRIRDPLDAVAEDVMWSDAMAIGMTENFAGMAGLVKDFFERIYYPCLEQTQGKPVVAYIRAGEDGQGTQRQLERILTGLRWNMVAPVLVLKGEWHARFLDETEQLTMTLAAGMESGIY